MSTGGVAAFVGPERDSAAAALSAANSPRAGLPSTLRPESFSDPASQRSSSPVYANTDPLAPGRRCTGSPRSFSQRLTVRSSFPKKAAIVFHESRRVSFGAGFGRAVMKCPEMSWVAAYRTETRPT